MSLGSRNDRRWVAAALALAVGLAAAGCGEAGGTGDDPNSAPSSAIVINSVCALGFTSDAGQRPFSSECMTLPRPIALAAAPLPIYSTDEVDRERERLALVSCMPSRDGPVDRLGLAPARLVSGTRALNPTVAQDLCTSMPKTGGSQLLGPDNKPVAPPVSAYGRMVQSVGACLPDVNSDSTRAPVLGPEMISGYEDVVIPVLGKVVEEIGKELDPAIEFSVGNGLLTAGIFTALAVGFVATAPAWAGMAAGAAAVAGVTLMIDATRRVTGNRPKGPRGKPAEAEPPSDACVAAVAAATQCVTTSSGCVDQEVADAGRAMRVYGCQSMKVFIGPDQDLCNEGYPATEDAVARNMLKICVIVMDNRDPVPGQPVCPFNFGMVSSAFSSILPEICLQVMGAADCPGMGPGNPGDRGIPIDPVDPPT